VESDEEVEQPPRQRRRVNGNDDDGDDGNDDDGDDGNDDDGDDEELELSGIDEDDNNAGDSDQMVKNLIRLAIACEYSRAPLRRSDITAKILGSNKRQFRNVFIAAQEQLQRVFGMTLVELPVREKITLQQKRAAAKSQSQQKTSNAWVLTSVLPDKFRIPDILPPSKVPTTEMESQYTALSSFIVSLIVLSGGSLAENKMDRYLRRTNLNDMTPFTQSNALTAPDKTEKLLKRMEKDGFIIKVKDNAGGEEVIDYFLGARGKVEIGEHGVTGMVKAVYGDVDEPDDLDRKIKRSLGVAKSRTQDEGTVLS